MRSLTPETDRSDLDTTKSPTTADFNRNACLEEEKNGPHDYPAIGGRLESVSTADKVDASIIYPTKFRLTMIMISLFISNFLVSLDRTIIAPAM